MKKQEYEKIVEYKDRQYSRSRPQYSVALSLLKNINYTEEQKNNIKVLDLGCGIGEFSDILKEKGFKNIICVDGMENFIDIVKNRGFETYQVNLEFEKLPFFDNSFDLIVSLDVIEHLWNTDYYLNEIIRILKPGGKFILTTTNYNYLLHRISYLLGRFEKIISSRSRHKKFYTEKSFYEEVINKFSILKYIGSVPKTKNKFTKNRIFQNLFSMQLGILVCTNK